MTVAATPRRQRTLRAYAAVVALAALGACTGADAAGPTPTTPPTSTGGGTATATSPTTTPTITKPTPTTDPVIAKIPTAARARNQTGAETFAAFYMEQVNGAFTKPSPEALSDLSGEDCKVCNAFKTAAQELRDKGERHVGLSISVDFSVANQYSPQRASIVLYVTQHQVFVVNKSGKKVDQTKGAKGAFLATVAFRGHWIVDRLQVIK